MSDINQVIDNLGRRIDVFAQDINSLSSQIVSASDAIGKAVKFINEKSSPEKVKTRKAGTPERDKKNDANELKRQVDKFEQIVGKLESSVDMLSGKLDEEIEKGRETVSKIDELIETLKQEAAQRKTESESLGSKEESLTKILQKNVEASSQLKLSVESMSRAIDNIPTSASIAGPPGGGGGGGSRGGGGGGGSRGGGGGGGYSDDEIQRIAESITGRVTDGVGNGMRQRAASWATEISALLLGGQGDILQTLFAGSVRDITDFRREARGLAFEIEGINASTRGMQAEFADMGEVARRTGKSMDVMQKLYMTNMRKGFKNQGKELKSVLKSGMHLSTMIGSNVDETGNMFADWNRTLGMSVHQMNQLAADTKNIALSTGVTGDELLGAMKSSEAILKNLRNQGNLTSASAKNVIQAMAEAKKLGVEDKAAGVLDMMTSTNKFLDGDAATQRFIVSMVGDIPGGTDAALGGTLMDDPNMLKGMLGKMDKTIESFTGGAAKSIADIDKLSRDDRMKLSVMLKQSFGMEIYEFESMFKVLEDQTKTLAERFSDLDSITKNNTKTEEEKALAIQKMNDLMIGSSMTLANKFAHATSKLNDQSEFDAAMARTSSEMTEAERLEMAQRKERAMKSTAEGGLGMTDADFAKTASFGASKDYADSLLMAAEAIKKQGKDKGIEVADLGPEILKAFESGKVTDIKAVQEKIAEQQQKLGIKEKTGNDPITELGQEINALNETIRKLVSGPFGVLIDVLGWVGLALAQVGLFGMVMYNRMGSLTRVFENTNGIMARFGTMLSDVQSGMGSLFNKLIGKKTSLEIGDVMKFRDLRKSGLSPVDAMKAARKQGAFSDPLGSNIFSRMADKFSDFFDNIAKKGFSGLWENIVSGFNWVRGKIWGGIQWLATSISNFFSKKINIGGFFSKITGIFKSAEGTSGAGGFLSNIKNMYKAFKDGGGIFGGIAKIFRHLSTAARANPIGFFLFAAVDGIMGAVEGYRSAAKIFGVETKELTTGMKISAGTAGGLVGILDGLTFGLLRMTGVARPLEEIFANIIYGFMWMGEGIKNGFMSWMPNVIGSFEWLGEAIGDLFGQMASIFGFDAQTSGQKWDAFFKIMENVGWFIGNILGGTLNAIVITLWVVVKAVQAVVWVFQVLFKVISSIGSFIANIFVGAFKLMFDAIYNISNIGGVIKNAWDGVVNWFMSLPGRLFDGMISLIPNWAKKLLGIGGTAGSNVNAPPPTPQVALAEGGVTTGPTNALIGEAGPEAVIPLDKLGGMMGQNKIAGEDFGKEKTISVQKKTQDISSSSNSLLKSIFSIMKRGGNASEGLFVHDLKAGLMLSLIFSHVNMLIERLDTLLNFMGKSDPELMQKSRAYAKADGVDRMANATLQLDGGIRKDIGMVDFMAARTMRTVTESAPGQIKGQPWSNAQLEDPEYGKRAEAGRLRTIELLNRIREPMQGLHDEATHKGSIWTHDPYLEKQAKLSRKEIPKAMWDSGDKVADAMEKQKERYSHGQGFERSAELASLEELKNIGTDAEGNAIPRMIEGGVGADGKIISMSLEDAMNRANAKLDDAARKRYQEDSKGKIAALDGEISKLHKQVMDESKKAGMHTAVTDMPSYKALSEAQKKREEFRSGVVPERYFKENTMMAALPGEDPSMLYESREQSMSHFKKKAEQEKDFINAEKKRLEGLKSKRAEVKSERSWGEWWSGKGKKTDELASIDAKIGDIEGISTPDYTKPGTIENAESRLKTWERESKKPSMRRTVGKNEWSGSSDTSVVLPGAGSGSWTPPPMSVPYNPADFEASDSVLEQNVEQTKKMETMEASAARSLEPGSIYTHDIHLEKLLSGMGLEGLSRAAVTASAAMEQSSSNLATPVGQHAVPVMRDDDGGGVAGVQPVALNEIGESILRDRAGGESGKLQSDELARMEEVAQNQYAETQRMREVMEMIAGYLKPSSDTVGSGPEHESRARATKKQVRPNIFGQIANKNGKPGGGPNRSVYHG